MTTIKLFTDLEQSKICEVMKKWKELLTIVKAIYKKKPFIIIGSDLLLHKFGEFDDKMYSLEDYIMDFTYKKN